MKSETRTAAAALAAALLLSPAAAQCSTTDLLAGWTNVPALPGPAGIDVQDLATCAPAQRLCSGVLLDHRIPWAGGTAWDPRHRSVWVSDGRTIEERPVTGCKTTCSVRPSLLRPTAVVTGLAVANARRLLFHLESSPGYLGIRAWDNAKCPPVPAKTGCTLQLGPREIAAGIAYDEDRDLLYYTTSAPGMIGWSTFLHVARASGTRCRPVCKVLLKPCGGPLDPWLPVLGLAYDACGRRLFATDGVFTRAIDMVDPLRCGVKFRGCCKKQRGAAWAGLAVVPGRKQASFGKSCVTQGCPPCATMVARLAGGAPSLGNRDFGIRLGQGPVQHFAFVLLGGGRCTGGMTLPILCARLYPALVPSILLPIVRITGRSTCDGTALMPLPIPADARLCGLELCAQWVVVCGSVLGATGALQFQVAGS